jgi:hypothetical protein
MPLPSDEPRISLKQAAAKYPGHRGAERLHPATLTRWILRGVRAVDGRRVRLEAERVGCRWCTSEAALGRFVVALSAATGDSPLRSPAERNRASEQAGAELKAMGA